MSSPSLYDRLGGQGAIDAFVPLFYEKVLADDRVNQFFSGIDMDAQGAKLNAFLPWALGALTTIPARICGRDTGIW